MRQAMNEAESDEEKEERGDSLAPNQCCRTALTATAPIKGAALISGQSDAILMPIIERIANL